MLVIVTGVRSPRRASATCCNSRQSSAASNACTPSGLLRNRALLQALLRVCRPTLPSASSVQLGTQRTLAVLAAASPSLCRAISHCRSITCVALPGSARCRADTGQHHRTCLRPKRCSQIVSPVFAMNGGPEPMNGLPAEDNAMDHSGVCASSIWPAMAFDIRVAPV